jgi:hypothetical protein
VLPGGKGKAVQVIDVADLLGLQAKKKDLDIILGKKPRGRQKGADKPSTGPVAGVTAAGNGVMTPDSATPKKKPGRPSTAKKTKRDEFGSQEDGAQAPPGDIAEPKKRKYKKKNQEQVENLNRVAMQQGGADVQVIAPPVQLQPTMAQARMEMPTAVPPVGVQQNPSQAAMHAPAGYYSQMMHRGGLEKMTPPQLQAPRTQSMLEQMAEFTAIPGMGMVNRNFLGALATAFSAVRPNGPPVDIYDLLRTMRQNDPAEEAQKVYDESVAS